MAYTPPSPSPQLQAVLDFVDSVNCRDYHRTANWMAQNFIHDILPPSLERPRRVAEETIEVFKQSLALIPDFKVKTQQCC
jgi:hypothetical protein